MAIETTQVREAPWAMWLTIDYAQNGDQRALHGLRCHNTSAVSVRISVTLGRGSNTVTRSAVVAPGEDRTYPATPEEAQPFPVSLRGSEWGIAVEQV